MRTHISFLIHLSILIGFWLHPPVFANTTHPAGSSSAVPNLSVVRTFGADRGVN